MQQSWPTSTNTQTDSYYWQIYNAPVRSISRFGLVGNVVGPINEVNQRWARLVLGWVTKTGKPPWYVTSHPHQLSLAIPPWVSAMSTSEIRDINRHTARCTSPVSVVWQCKLVSGWGLKKRRSPPPYVPYGSRRTLLYYRYTQHMMLMKMERMDFGKDPHSYWLLSW